MNLEPGLKALALSLSEKQAEALLAHCQLLIKWNKSTNLTAITDLPTMVTHHVYDSLSILPYLPAGTVLDVGSGAGFPAIPLAIANPGLQITALDSNNKKTRFLTHVKGQLGLDNLTIAHDRMQDYRSPHPFDAIIGRAVSSLSTLVEQTEHLLAPTGRFLFMKGQFPQDELNAITHPYEVHALSVPGLNADRHVVEIKPIREANE